MAKNIHLTQNTAASGIEFEEKTVNIEKGGLLTANATQVPTVLPVGADNKILTADSSTATGLKWADPAVSAESDPIFVASPAYGILASDIVNWNAGSVESDPIVGAITGIVKADGAGNISAADQSDIETILVGDISSHTHSSYLTAETDPVFVASPAYGIAASDILAWNAGGGSTTNYRANTVFVGSGAQTVAFNTAFPIGTSIVMLPLMGLTAEGDLIMQIASNITINGFDTAFGDAVTVTYLAIELK